MSPIDSVRSGYWASTQGIGSRGRFVADTDPDELKRVLRTDVFGAHRLCALAIPGMRAMDRGDIVIISSVAARE
jgi:3-oxoacyl-[acyl-carrier protein] reductase